jgi:hypothetical protein
VQLYKVYIENLKPVSARETDVSAIKNALESDGTITWIPVFAESEEDSLEVANSIIADL